MLQYPSDHLVNAQLFKGLWLCGLPLALSLLNGLCLSVDNVDLGTACGKLHRVSVLAITDPGMLSPDALACYTVATACGCGTPSHSA